jgi:hypothetical protein
LRHAVRRRGAVLALVAGLVALAGPAVIMAIDLRPPETNMVRYWGVVSSSQLGGLAAIALGISALSVRGRRAPLAVVGIVCGAIGGFLGAAYGFSG